MAAKQQPRRRQLHADGHDLGPELARAFFDVLSCGLLLVDRRGTIVAANATVRRLLGEDLDVLGESCCDLFGCHDPEGDLDGHCLSRQTLESGRLRSISVRCSTGRGPTTVVVTTTRLGDEHVLIELQGGELRRGLGHRAPAAVLNASLLGPTRLEDERGSVGHSWLEHRPGQLLKFLIAERHRVVPVDEIAEALWANAGPLGAGNVRQCVYEVRSRVDPDRDRRGGPSLIIAHRGGYSIDRRRIHVDCDEFEFQANRGMAAFRAGDAETAEKQLSAGMALYRGEFLSDEPYAHWALEERTRLAGMAATALRALALLAVQRQDYDGAARHLERLTALDGYDTDIQRALISLCLVRGRRSEAKRRYTTLCSRLRHDFDEEPGFDLADASLRGNKLQQLLAV